MNPLDAVRQSSAMVAKRARYVKVREDAINVLAERIVAGEMPRIAWDDKHHFRDGSPATAQYLLVLDALNFCFWPEPSWDYNRLALALKNSMLGEPERFEARTLARASEADVSAMLGATGGELSDIPLLPQRTMLLREVGEVLVTRWEGQALALVHAAQHSAAALVRLVTAELPGFRDHAIFGGWPVYIYKRAQIFVGDVWGSYEGEGAGHFNDIDRLTMFADYRIPQLLRGEGILEYNARLASIVDLCRELPSGSDLEIEIRAASIHAVEILRELLAARGLTISALELDWILWNVGEARQQEFQPHHRTLTIYY